MCTHVRHLYLHLAHWCDVPLIRIFLHMFPLLQCLLIGWVFCFAQIFPNSLTASSSLLRSGGTTPASTAKTSKPAVTGTSRHIARPLLCTLSRTSHWPVCHTGAAYSSCGITMFLYNLTCYLDQSSLSVQVFLKLLAFSAPSPPPTSHGLETSISRPKLHPTTYVFYFSSKVTLPSWFRYADLRLSGP